jgi:hypothetical protein
MFQKKSVSIFTDEDGDSMFLQNVGICLILHGVTSQNNNTAVLTAVRTSILSSFALC